MAARLSVVLVLLIAIALVTSSVNGARDVARGPGSSCTTDDECRRPLICRKTESKGPICGARTSSKDHTKNYEEACFPTSISECKYPFECEQKKDSDELVCQ